MRRVFLAHRFIVAFIVVFSSFSVFSSQAAAQADPPENVFTDRIVHIEFRRPLAETEAPASSGGVTKVSGIVINAVTGEPVPRALVTIESLSTLTGTDGRFQFSRLRDSQATPSAEKPGFLNDLEMQPENFRYGLSSSVVQDGQTFTIPLTPAGIFTGRVLDSNGEPMEGVVVTPLASIVTNGCRHIQPRTAVTTRKDGVFRIDSLPPGSYFLEVAPRASAATSGKSGFPSLDAPPGADYQPITFYPGVTDFSTAVALDLRPGATVQADFTLAMAPAFRLSGRITGVNEPQNTVLWLAHPSGRKLELRNNYDAKTGAFSFMNVPAGEYLLGAEGSKQVGTPVYGETKVTVHSRDVKMDLAVREIGDLKVEIREDPPASEPAHTQVVAMVSVRLRPAQPLGQERLLRFARFAGGMVAPNNLYVDPGTYHVEFIPDAPFHVASANYGGRNLLREDLVVSPDLPYQPFQIVLNRDGATVSGTVQPEMKSPGAVLLLPRSPALQARVARIDKNNRYELQGVAPGDYDLFAFDRIEDLEYHDPAFLRTYEDRARHVSLRAHQAESVALDVISRDTR